MNKRTYRMYGLVPYNLSPIQQGIQFGHAVVEYSLHMADTRDDSPVKIAYNRWARHDKTFIILNGGTTNSRRFDGEYVGTLNKHLEVIYNSYGRSGHPIAEFREPDLGDQLTAFVFLVDDRVFDKVAWPDYNGPRYEDGTPDPTSYYEWKMKFANDEDNANAIVFMRDYLKNLRLA
jgi:hypothetical protein